MNARKTILKVCAWITARLDPPRRATNEEILDLAPDAYWREPSDSTDSVYFWKDFDESKGREVKRGMLSSDQIRQYATELRMIEPYNPVQIKPASYDLTLGPLYQIDGEDHVLSKEKPTLEIPPNSIVFVAMGERLMLPHYVIGRFDLQIEFIYQGLLLGTGPQVDPGFRGVLSCPLHNISNTEIRIGLGQALAKIDFEKTSGLPADAVEFLDKRGVTNADQLYDAGAQLRERYGVILFNKSKWWRRPITGSGLNARKVTSSVKSLSDRVTLIYRVGYIGAGALILTVAGLLIGMMTLVASDTRASSDAARAASDANAVNAQLVERITTLSTQVSELTNDRAALNGRLSRLEAQTGATAAASP